MGGTKPEKETAPDPAGDDPKEKHGQQKQRRKEDAPASDDRCRQPDEGEKKGMANNPSEMYSPA